MTARVRAATLELLEEVGYDGLRIPDVAARAGVNRTTIYRRWPTRPELVAALLADLADEEVPQPDTGSLAGDLVVMLSQVAGLLRTRAIRAVIRAAIMLADEDPAADGLRRAFWDRQLGDASIVVSRAVRRGELPPDTDPRAILERAFGPLYFRMLVLGDDVTDDDVASLASSVVPPR